MKKSKVIKLDELPLIKGQQYPSSSIEFEDGMKGLTKSEFKVGEVMEYLVEVRMSKQGKEYNYITRPKSEYGTKSGGYRKDYEGMNLCFNAGHATDLFLMPPFNEMKFSDIAEVVIKRVGQKQATLATDREKDFVSTAMKCSVKIYQDEHQRQKFQKAMKLDGKDGVKELELVYSIFEHTLKTMLDANKALS